MAMPPLDPRVMYPQISSRVRPPSPTTTPTLAPGDYQKGGMLAQEQPQPLNVMQPFNPQGRNYVATNQQGQQMWVNPNQATIQAVQQPGTQFMQPAKPINVAPPKFSKELISQPWFRGDGQFYTKDGKSGYNRSAAEQEAWLAYKRQQATADRTQSEKYLADKTAQTDAETLQRRMLNYKEQMDDFPDELKKYDSVYRSLQGQKGLELMQREWNVPGSEGEELFKLRLQQSIQANPAFAALPFEQQRALILSDASSNEQDRFDSYLESANSRYGRIREFFANPDWMGNLTPEQRVQLGINDDGTLQDGWNFDVMRGTQMTTAPGLTEELLANQKTPGMLSSGWADQVAGTMAGRYSAVRPSEGEALALRNKFKSQ